MNTYTTVHNYLIEGTIDEKLVLSVRAENMAEGKSRLIQLGNSAIISEFLETYLFSAADMITLKDQLETSVNNSTPLVLDTSVDSGLILVD